MYNPAKNRSTVTDVHVITVRYIKFFHLQVFLKQHEKSSLSTENLIEICGHCQTHIGKGNLEKILIDFVSETSGKTVKS